MTDRAARSRLTAWAFVAIAASLVWFEWSAVQPVLLAFVRAVDGFAFSAYNTISTPLFEFRSSPIPLIAPLVIGLMASVAPCQLSTGTASLAFIAQAGRERLSWRAVAFIAARVLLYAIFGAVAILVFGGQVRAPGAVLSGIRRVLGPLTVLIGLVTLGVIPFRGLWLPGAFGARVSTIFAGWSEARGGTLGAFLLGVAFSFAFCPTLFLLFFGLTVPLALSAPLGFAYPAVFALGMSLPLLAFTGLISSTTAQNDTKRGFLREAGRTRRWLMPLAGVIFVLAGVFDTLRYWLV